MSESSNLSKALVLAGILAAELLFIGIFYSSREKVSASEFLPAQNIAQTTSGYLRSFPAPEAIQIHANGYEYVADKKELETWIRGSRKGLKKIAPDNLTAYAWTKLTGETPEANQDKQWQLVLNEELVGSYLLGVKTQLNHEAHDAVLMLENGRAIDFIPDRDGVIADLFMARKQIIAALEGGKTAVDLPVIISSPKVKLADLNSLGINELLVSGQSDFTGSSAARITNIRVGSSKYNGLIVKPGEEFSFTDNLGKVDAAHGFLPELVIKPEGATPEFGGGLCQVSTTAFRAAFFAGLPITARRNHSYAVHYYDWIADDQPRTPGLDATIYSGVQDMKFLNDTPGAILIWTRMEGKRLYFDFYGTRDGRAVAVDGPHAYDRKSSGAVKATVTRTVTKSRGEPEIVTFNSSYVPPKTLPQVTEYPKPPPEVPAPPLPLPEPTP